MPMTLAILAAQGLQQQVMYVAMDKKKAKAKKESLKKAQQNLVKQKRESK